MPRKHNISVMILPLIAGLLFGCSQSSDSQNKGHRATPVVIYHVQSEIVANRIEALGTAVASESINITPKTTARIVRINTRDGQNVAKGDLLVELDADEPKAQLDAARAQLAEHRREIERLKKLLNQQAAASRDLDTRLTQAAIARSTIHEIEARISELTLKAPFAGRLGIRRASPGELVQPGQMITTLDAIEPIYLDFSVPATLLAQLKPGMPLNARADGLPDEQFSGEISALDTRIDPQTRSIMARATIANPEGHIRPGLLMHISLLQDEHMALIIPEESITQRQSEHFVTVVGEGDVAELRKVAVGHRYPGKVEILSGLQANERVVVRGMGIVKPGGKVHIQQTWQSMNQPLYGGPRQ